MASACVEAEEEAKPNDDVLSALGDDKVAEDNEPVRATVFVPDPLPLDEDELSVCNTVALDEPAAFT